MSYQNSSGLPEDGSNLADGNKYTPESAVIVDDEDLILGTLGMMLESLYETESIEKIDSTGTPVLQVAGQVREKITKDALLILDGGFAGGDAGDVIDALKDDLNAKGIHIIVSSGKPETQDRIEHIYPCVSFLSKPFTLSELTAVVQSSVPFKA